MGWGGCASAGHSGQQSGRMKERAISSAVEHLPYKEIVTGSIPVSPISRGRSAAHWGLWKFQGSGRLACIAVAKHAVSTVGGFA